MKTPEEIANEVAADWIGDGVTRDQDFRLARAAVEADRAQWKTYTAPATAVNYEVVHFSDPSGDWVNLLGFDPDRSTLSGDTGVPIISILLSSYEAAQLARELRTPAS